MTQQQLADAVGVTVQTINSLENNRYTPSVFVCLLIADYFDKPIGELFFLEESEKLSNKDK